MVDAKFSVFWTDHYHFDVRDKGERVWKNCDANMLGMVLRNFPGSVEENERPKWTLLAWVRWFFEIE